MLVVALGVSLYGVKLLANPTGFTFFDELSHARTTLDIFNTGHLLHPNPLQPISPYYPGLKIVTAAFARLTGLSLFVSGIAIIGIGRVVLVAALYAIFKEVSHSSRVAGIATVLYMTNPSFLYFDAQFSYESFALPLAAVALLLTLRWMRLSPERAARPLLVCAAGITAAVVVTHHVTSYLLVVFMLGLCVCALIARRWGGTSRPPWQLTLFAGVAAVAWLTGVASSTVPYLTSVLGPAVTGPIHVITGGETARAAFAESTGAAATPVWLKATAFASVLIVVACLPYGLALAWRRRSDAQILFFGAVAVGYLPAQALRLTGAGVETSNRAAEFVFIGVGFLIALLIVHALDNLALPSIRVWRAQRDARIRLAKAKARIIFPLVALLTVAILTVGGVTILWPPYARLPGPYLPGADVRQVSPQGIAAAEWMRKYLGPHHQVLTDRTTGQLLGYYGEQDPANGSGESAIGPLPLVSVLFSPKVTVADRELLRSKRVAYIVIDRRLATGLPARGWYFASFEPGAFEYKRPIPIKLLTKLVRTRGVTLIYDNGPIQIYDVRDLSRS